MHVETRFLGVKKGGAIFTSSKNPPSGCHRRFFALLAVGAAAGRCRALGGRRGWVRCTTNFILVLPPSPHKRLSSAEGLCPACPPIITLVASSWVISTSISNFHHPWYSAPDVLHHSALFQQLPKSTGDSMEKMEFFFEMLVHSTHLFLFVVF